MIIKGIISAADLKGDDISEFRLSEEKGIVQSVFMKQTSEKAETDFYDWYSANEGNYKSPMYGVMDYLS